MQSALDLAVAAAGEGRARRIVGIRLRLGEFAGVDVDALRFAFEALRPGTMAESAYLDIESVPAGRDAGCIELTAVEVEDS
ncbi:MAG: hydrogenase maturation nickel metallochaperone HypA [Gemmataceae bacterium]|nr:hydrogenase maturation nickel metallochaperone HypA [Gemmataceae bacterium]